MSSWTPTTRTSAATETTTSKNSTTFTSIPQTSNLDQHQDSEGTNFGFGQTAGTRYRGQNFTPSITSSITKIGFSRAIGADGIKVYFDTTTSHLPTNSVANALYSFTIPNSSLVDGYGTYSLPVPLAVTAGTEYCFYLAPWDTTNDVYIDDYHDVHGVNTVPGGLEITNTAGTWSNENLTFHFGIYMSTALTTINQSSTPTFTQTTRIFEYLWASTTFPWELALPWQLDNGQPFTLQLKS